MDHSDSDQPDSKRHNSTSGSFTMARNSTSSPTENRALDASVLQYQNQKLVQQLDTQKHELLDIEAKMKELNDKQTSYDDMLITVNQLWNQLIDDLILLGVRAGRGPNDLKNWDCSSYSRGSIPSCPAEQMFLCRLLDVDSIPEKDSDGIVRYVEEALAVRRSSTMELMKSLEDTIDAQRRKTESIALAWQRKESGEDVIILLSKIDDMMKEEVDNLQEAIDVLHMKHKEYADQTQTYISGRSTDRSEIERLKGELGETMAELEENRRKLVNLNMQKGGSSGRHTLAPGAVNGSTPPEKPTDKTLSSHDLKDSIEETRFLAERRLSELEDAREENLILSKQLEDLQNQLEDDKYVISSRPYNLLHDQLQHWNAEVERYKTQAESLQADRSLFTRREKELNAKAQSADAARNAIGNAESMIEELELQLQKCIMEKNDLEIKMEEALQDSGRKDIKSEFHVMASALSKEMGMMEAQLNRGKDTAHEAHSLREEAQKLRSLLTSKTNEEKSLSVKCSIQMEEIKSLAALVEKLQKDKLEMEIFVDMYGQESCDNRDIMEIKESERKAHAQAEILQNALDEHGLELRVRAANEAEAACQQRLAAAEAEIAQLRAELYASEREELELAEAIRIKDLEQEAYITEIETIGQAYEDMQAQNQRLLQQLAERDDYNIKLVSESVKIKQSHGVLLSEKQALSKQLQQINTSVESSKQRIVQSEDKMKACLTEAIKSTQENRHLAITLEKAKWELAYAEKEYKWLKSAIASSDKEYEQIHRKKNETESTLQRERSERKKLEEDVKELNRQVAEMSSGSGEAAIQKLQEEIKDIKSILKCGVCSDRPKEVVILKCYHLFCNPCIQKNLELRNRKCPGCGTAFGQNDVRFVKI